MHIAVLGAGSWGTAIAIVAGRSGHDVTLVGRNQDDLDVLRVHRENLHYLPGFVIPENVAIADFQNVPEADLTVLAVPSQAVRSTVRFARREKPVIAIAAKGLEALSAKPLADVVAEVVPFARIAVLSGPNLAVEIVQESPSAAVAASHEDDVADLVRTAFTSRHFRVYASRDVIGVELAGSLKNVLAVGAGMSDGFGFGDNTKAALMARGLREMILLGLAMGAHLETFLGIAGVGDLFATASSSLSRNYRVGRALAEGKALAQALHDLGQVAEGVQTSEAATVLAARHGVEMPIFSAIEAVIRGKIEPRRAVSALMERDTRNEGYDWLPRP